MYCGRPLGLNGYYTATDLTAILHTRLTMCVTRMALSNVTNSMAGFVRKNIVAPNVIVVKTQQQPHCYRGSGSWSWRQRPHHLLFLFFCRPPVWLQTPPSLFPPVPRSPVYVLGQFVLLRNGSGPRGVELGSRLQRQGSRIRKTKVFTSKTFETLWPRTRGWHRLNTVAKLSPQISNISTWGESHGTQNRAAQNHVAQNAPNVPANFLNLYRSHTRLYVDFAWDLVARKKTGRFRCEHGFSNVQW